MDERPDLKKAKMVLLVQLQHLSDDEKTTSDVELEAALMNDWEIDVDCEPENPYAGLLAMFERMAIFFRR